MPSHARSFSAAAILYATVLPACSAPPAPAPPPHIVAKTPPPPAPPLSPWRWLVSGERNQAVSVAGGTLRLVGGRRLLLAANGASHWQTDDLPRPLDQLLVVPTAQGPRLVGRAGDAVYRFDEPLGPGRPLLPPGTPVSSIQGMPGLVVVATSDMPFAPTRFFSVEDGKETPQPPALPDFPLSSVAFEDELHGAALLVLSGAWVTRDGGATWQRPWSKRPSGVVLDISSLDEVDIKAGKLDGIEEGTETPSAAAPIEAPKALPAPGASIPLGELVDLDRDPMATAALAGVAAPDGGAWIAWNGLVLHFDLATAAATVVAAIPGVDPKNTPWCDLRSAGRDVWVGCRPRDQLHSALTSVFRGKVEGGKLSLGPREAVPPSATELRVSPSGGVLAFVPGSQTVDVAARHASGQWRSVSLGASHVPESAGPLADGRVALLKKTKPGQEPPHVVVVTPGSEKEEALPPLDHPVLSAFGPIEEDAAHVLHFFARDNEGVFAVAQPIDGGAARAVRIPGAFAARLHGGKGIALTEQGVLVSTDSGMTWSPIPAPPGVLAMLVEPKARSFVPGDAGAVRLSMAWEHGFEKAFAVGEIGAILGDHLRLGWGAEAASPVDPPEVPITPEAPPPPLGKRYALSCRAAGAAASSLSPRDETWTDLTHVKLPAGLSPEGGMIDQEDTVAISGEDDSPPEVANSLGAMALFVQGAPEPKSLGDQPPRRWLLRWLDPGEIGSRPRTWQGAAPTFEDHVTRVRRIHKPGQDVPMRVELRDAHVAGIASRDGRAIAYVSGLFSEPSDEGDVPSGAGGVSRGARDAYGDAGDGFHGAHVDYGDTRNLHSYAGALVRLSATGKGEVFRVIVGDASLPSGTFGEDHLRMRALEPGLVHNTRILDDRLMHGGSSLRGVAFGGGPGAPIAGILAHQLFVWFEGKPMVPIAQLPNFELYYRAQMIVGEPSTEGVPLLVLAGKFQRFGLVPIPRTSPAVPPLLDGVAWKRLPTPLVLERLPSCNAGAPGMRFTLHANQPSLRVLIDGKERATTSATFDVRATERGACVSRASVHFEGKDESDESDESNVRFVRADLASRRAEGGAVDAPKGKVKKLACAWIATPEP
ncbi:hypothetical protein [Polyangium sp. 6x1]|uniref:hypothetical protein n=1 Tax=Polyangium sp. 6x1 TaxID=3042689 RepID=UPI002482BA9C|nr:hypothetical protein [Polyangium sp. 6x1]MDI1452112.1 hypothetical protein [Polyangium sp. 6x1]